MLQKGCQKYHSLESKTQVQRVSPIPLSRLKVLTRLMSTGHPPHLQQVLRVLDLVLSSSDGNDAVV